MQVWSPGPICALRLSLEASELANLLAKMGQEYSDDEVALILKQIDQDSSGTVEFVEFLRWWTGNSDPPDAEMKIVDKNKQELAAQIPQPVPFPQLPASLVNH